MMTNKIKLDKWQAADTFKRGYSLFRCGQYDEAANYFLMCILLAPKEYLYWSSLGHAQRRGGNLNEAIESYKAAVLIGGSKDSDLLFALAESLKERGDNRPAFKALKEAILHAEPEFQTRLKMIKSGWYKEFKNLESERSEN